MDQELRKETLARKREEYADLVKHYFGGAELTDTVELLTDKIQGMSPYEVKNFKQVKIDVHRTQPDIALFSTPALQTMMIRILFVWAMRHPAMAYVQGINDLAAPLVLAFL